MSVEFQRVGGVLTSGNREGLSETKAEASARYAETRRINGISGIVVTRPSGKAVGFHDRQRNNENNSMIFRKYDPSAATACPTCHGNSFRWTENAANFRSAIGILASTLH